LSRTKFADLPRWLRDFAPLIFWMALIFFLSSQSRLVDIESDTGDKLFYKSAHIIAYAALTWFWWRALAARRRITWPVLSAACLLAIIYGVSDEIHQLYVPGRNGHIADVLFDASGALLMVLLLRRLAWLQQFPEMLPFSWPAGKNSLREIKFKDMQG